MNEPSATRQTALFLGTPNKKAATDPVHTPVIGRGMATKTTKASEPSLSWCRQKRLYVLSNNQSKNFLKNRERTLSSFDMPPREYIKNAPGKTLPIQAKINAEYIGMLKTPSAIGIAPRSSETGRTAIKKVINSTGKFKLIIDSIMLIPARYNY